MITTTSVEDVLRDNLARDFPGWDIDRSDPFDLAARRDSDGFACTGRVALIRTAMMHADAMEIRAEVQAKTAP